MNKKKETFLELNTVIERMSLILKYNKNDLFEIMSYFSLKSIVKCYPNSKFQFFLNAEKLLLPNERYIVQIMKYITMLLIRAIIIVFIEWNLIVC